MDLKQKYESTLNPVYRAWVSFALFLLGAAFFVSAIITKNFTFLWVGTLIWFVYTWIQYTETVVR